MDRNRLNDERFWKNYFYNVEVIKMKYNANSKIGPKSEENIENDNLKEDNEAVQENTCLNNDEFTKLNKDEEEDEDNDEELQLKIEMGN